MNRSTWKLRSNGTIGRLAIRRTAGNRTSIDDRYQRFDEISGREVEVDNESTIKRDGSINAIATGSRTIVAGGYVRKENRVVKYSSGGPISPASGAVKAVNRQEPDDLERTGPDALARSDESYVHQGILAAGTRSGSVVVMNGTSVAAPQIARQIAKVRGEGSNILGAILCRSWESRLNPFIKESQCRENRVTTQRRHHRSALVRASSPRQRLNERSSAWIGLDDAFSNAEKSTQSA